MGKRTTEEHECKLLLRHFERTDKQNRYHIVELKSQLISKGEIMQK